MEDLSPPLPREIMESQLSMMDLLTAMFPESHELTINPETHNLIEHLRSWCNNENQEKPPLSTIPPNLSIALHLSIESESGSSNSIQLNISVPLRSDEVDVVEAPPMKFVIRQPDWMSRAEVAELSACIPIDDIFSTIEYIRDEAPKYIKSNPQQMSTSTTDNEVQEPLSRVWFYFPSLSTREKRDDLVNHAPRYNLTGFVLAGKPGVLCLEGVSGDVDTYMKFIKTESWGDIPSYQKKVSERYREEGVGVVRVFEGMVEITSSLGDRGGARGNRGDMQALEAWLVERGLGDAFKRVVM